MSRKHLMIYGQREPTWSYNSIVYGVAVYVVPRGLDDLLPEDICDIFISLILLLLWQPLQFVLQMERREAQQMYTILIL